MKYKAAIFDLDGTVVSDEDEYGEAFNRVLRRFGIDTGSTLTLT
jgi:beta-phosphoglucomutase-like phosphatase (HAD superfamily)